ncbi:MAG TPA: LLM class flavin-dependent oxidoreductase [Steroidobacteraceae bacterium]|nr:LLM class flavin-dependent oxidoreductase [Steroidobacteraceae bacterium]
MSDKRPNVGVIFKSYEPLRAIQSYARQTEESGYPGGFWIAEAYHWFRKYGHEARGCFTTLAAATMATSRIPIGLGITSPYMRHPTIQASESNAIDELSGGRFIMGLGAGKVGTEYLDIDMKKFTPVRTHAESIDMIRGIASGDAFRYDGELFKCDMPAIDRARRGLRTNIPVYVGATGPQMQKLAGRMADGLLLPGLTSPGFTRYAVDNCRAGATSAGRKLAANFPVGGVILAACSRDRRKAKDATRSYTGTYVINKLRNIKNDVILSTSGLPDESWEPFRKAIAAGTEGNVTHLVSDEMQRAFTVISGTPDDCLEITQELIDAGLNTPLLEVVGASAEDNLETIKLFGEAVLPKLRSKVA